MGYSDQKFYARPLVKEASINFGTSTGAGTASNSLGIPAGTYLPKFIKRTQVKNVRVACTTIPNASATAVVISLLNGTNTFAAITVTTATQGQFLDGVMTASNAVFAAGGAVTGNIIGTFTASGGNAGVYDVYFEEQELFDPSVTQA